jgi:proline iminopeptidase
MYANIRNTRIFFDIDGAGLVPDGSRMRNKPVAFLVHGGPGSDHSSFKLGTAAMTERFQVVFFDHRGQGRSEECEPHTYTLDENVRDMEELRRHLGLDQIASIGTSYGGMVAMAHAARFPDTVSHLVLVATAAHAGFISRAQQIVAERGTADQIAECEALLAGRLDTPDKMRRYYEVMGPLYSRKFDPTTLKARLDRGILSPQPLNRAFGPTGFLRGLDLRGELSAITAPTLILAGRHDWICAPEFSKEIHRLIAKSDLRIFEESSHSIRADETQSMLDAIAGFVVYKGREAA